MSLSSSQVRQSKGDKKVTLSITITYEDGRLVTEEIDLRQFLIGRACEADIQINDPGVSRHHAMISINKDSIIICDLYSRNGTIVDGQELRRAQVTVKSSTVIKVGSTSLVLKLV